MGNGLLAALGLKPPATRGLVGVHQAPSVAAPAQLPNASGSAEASPAASAEDAPHQKFAVLDMSGEPVVSSTKKGQALQSAFEAMCRTWSASANDIVQFRSSLSALPKSDHPSYDVVVALSKVPVPWYVEERYEAALKDTADVLATLLDDDKGLAEAGKRLGWVADIYTKDGPLIELARGLRLTGVTPSLPEPAALFKPLLSAAI